MECDNMTLIHLLLKALRPKEERKLTSSFCCCYRPWVVLSPSSFWPVVQSSMSESPDPLHFDSHPPGFLTSLTPSGPRLLPSPGLSHPSFLLQIVTSASCSPCDYWHPGPSCPQKLLLGLCLWLSWICHFLLHSVLQPPKAEYCSFYAIIHNSDTQGVCWAWE